MSARPQTGTGWAVPVPGSDRLSPTGSQGLSQLFQHSEKSCLPRPPIPGRTGPERSHGGTPSQACSVVHHQLPPQSLLSASGPSGHEEVPADGKAVPVPGKGPERCGHSVWPGCHGPAPRSCPLPSSPGCPRRRAWKPTVCASLHLWVQWTRAPAGGEGVVGVAG